MALPGATRGPPELPQPPDQTRAWTPAEGQVFRPAATGACCAATVLVSGAGTEPATATGAGWALAGSGEGSTAAADNAAPGSASIAVTGGAGGERDNMPTTAKPAAAAAQASRRGGVIL